MSDIEPKPVQNVDSAVLKTRDMDIRIAKKIASIFIDNSSGYFVLTGSYSIEALTCTNITHNDIDANVFTTDISDSIANTALILQGSNYADYKLIKQTESRLEYSISTTAGERKLELQFVKITSIVTGSYGMEYVLDNCDNPTARVPTTIGILVDSLGDEYPFKVKTLPYAIATWALRISGIAIHQKRAVVKTDVDHLACLLSTPYKRDDVIDAMSHHPQMPNNCSAEQILSQVINSCNNSGS